MDKIVSAESNRKLEALASFPHIDAAMVTAVGQILERLDDWELLRINPLQFANQYGFQASELADLFIHGAKVGLFDFVWQMLCAQCGAVVRRHYSINDIESDLFHCALCHVDVPVNLDDQVEVAFTINPSVKRLNIDPFKDAQSYLRFFFSPNFQCSEALARYIGDVRRGTALIKPDEVHPLSFVAEPGALYRLMSIEHHVACFLQTTARRSTGPQVLDIDLLPTGFAPARADIAAGSIVLNVRNLLKTDAGVVLCLTDFPRLRHILQHHPSTMAPFFTGKMLLNNQSFRDLFRVQHLVPGLKLPLRSLTVLFTDLKGSTELYDRTGDAFAYGLVQEHYRLLSEAVREHAGAVVKTMGDAIMATFCHPHSAVLAAISMIQRLKAMSERWQTGGYQLGLKIGLHAGPALAVSAEDRLDYFGQTVNIAARVQNLAQAGEIWLTEPVLHATGVQETLVATGYREEKHLVALKGVGQPTTVYQCLALPKEGQNFACHVPAARPVAASNRA